MLPMLLSNWNLLLKLSADYPRLIPSGSLAGRIATRLWGDGVWLAWLLQEKDEDYDADEEFESLYPSFKEIEESVVQYVTHLLPTSLDQAKFVQTDDEDEEPFSQLFKSDVDEQQLKTYFSDRQVVQSLRVPRSVASQAAASLSKKVLKG